MNNQKKCTEIQVAELFHISNNTTYLVCNMKSDCEVSFPSEWKLFEGSKFITNVKLEGMVMDGHKISHEELQTMTFWTSGHLEKEIFNFKEKMILSLVE